MTTTTKPASQILREARALIEKPERWCRGNYCIRRTGQRCAVGALREVTGDATHAPIEQGELCRLLAQAGGGMDYPSDFTQWNDDHSHAEVMAAFDKAIELAEAKEASRG